MRIDLIILRKHSIHEDGTDVLSEGREICRRAAAAVGAGHSG